MQILTTQFRIKYFIYINNLLLLLIVWPLVFFCQFWIRIFHISMNFDVTSLWRHWIIYYKLCSMHLFPSELKGHWHCCYKLRALLIFPFKAQKSSNQQLQTIVVMGFSLEIPCHLTSNYKLYLLWILPFTHQTLQYFPMRYFSSLKIWYFFPVCLLQQRHIIGLISLWSY